MSIIFSINFFLSMPLWRTSSLVYRKYNTEFAKVAKVFQLQMEFWTDRTILFAGDELSFPNINYLNLRKGQGVLKLLQISFFYIMVLFSCRFVTVDN